MNDLHRTHTRSTITLTILHEHPIDGQDIGDIIERCNTGDCVLIHTRFASTKLTPTGMRRALESSGSDPDFFNDDPTKETQCS